MSTSKHLLPRPCCSGSSGAGLFRLLVSSSILQLCCAQLQFPDVQPYMTLGTLPPPAYFRLTPISPVVTKLPEVANASLGPAFSLLGCKEASKYSLPRSMSFQMNSSLAFAAITLEDGTTQQIGKPCSPDSAGRCKFYNFTLLDNEFITNLSTCTKGIPGIATSNQYSGFKITTNLGRAIDGGACQYGAGVCFCQSQPVGSGILCGVYGYGPPSKESVISNVTSGFPEGGLGYLYEMNVFSFAFLSPARSATLDSFAYPFIGQQLIQLQPQSGSSFYSVTLSNDSPLQQAYSRELTLTKTLSNTWTSGSSLQNAVATRTSTSRTDSTAWKVSATAKVEAGIPIIGSGSLETSAEFAKNSTVQVSSERDLSSQVTSNSNNGLEFQETYEDKQSFPIVVPPNSTLTWSAQLRSGQIALKYTAQLRLAFYDGTSISVPIEGSYSGVSASGTTVSFVTRPITPAVAG